MRNGPSVAGTMSAISRSGLRDDAAYFPDLYPSAAKQILGVLWLPAELAALVDMFC